MPAYKVISKNHSKHQNQPYTQYSKRPKLNLTEDWKKTIIEESLDEKINLPKLIWNILDH